LLNEHFANAEPSHYHTIGRYLLGKASEAELLAEAIDQKKSNEIYYFIGLKAKTEGRYRDAADWFWLTMEMGTMNNGETRWALDPLYLWWRRERASGFWLRKIVACEPPPTQFRLQKVLVQPADD
jgi:hypothetical protein